MASDADYCISGTQGQSKQLVLPRIIDEHNEWEEFHKHTGLESTNRKRPKYDMMPRSNRAPIENGQDEVPFKTYSV